MAVKILEMKRESCPAARFIGKRYVDGSGWGEWWANGWFDIIESIPGLPVNDDGYIGAFRVVDGAPEYWIGMFFPAGTEVPEGFEHADIEPLDYAVFYLFGSETSGELTCDETRSMCLADLTAHGFDHRPDDWCFERYNCPRFTTPDEDGNVILDFGVAIH